MSPALLRSAKELSGNKKGDRLLFINKK